jgi:cytochrome c biogenesis protein
MKQRIFRFLADLRFAIFILILLSLFSMLGTIIEQDQPIEVYKLNYPLTSKLFSFLSWKLILQLGLDHVYKTWWFYGLILIFSMSLITCTFLQQFPALKIAQRCQFFRVQNSFKQLKFYRTINISRFNKVLKELKQAGYSFFQQKNLLYCYKGLIGRIAPIIVHFSLILILFGTLVGAVSGFKAQEIVPKSEVFHIQNVFNNGQLSDLTQQCGRVNDFWITYTEKKTINQFYSDISLLDENGNEIKRNTCFVNTPFVYKNVYFYQTDWNLIGLRLKMTSSEPIEYPLVNINNNTKVWLTWVSLDSTFENGILILVDSLKGYTSIYTSVGEFLGNLESNEELTNVANIKLIETLSSTGLQIKTDPGIPVIYTGFFFLMLSTLISYITYSQIWVVKAPKNLFIGGTTTRDLFEFEFEFLNIVK